MQTRAANVLAYIRTVDLSHVWLVHEPFPLLSTILSYKFKKILNFHFKDHARDYIYCFFVLRNLSSKKYIYKNNRKQVKNDAKNK